MLNLLTWIFDRKLKPRRVRKALDQCCTGEKSTCRQTDGTAVVSCVQHEIKSARNVEEYIKSLDGFVRKAAEQGSCLVVFPEYNFLDMFGFIPGSPLVDAFLQRRTENQIEKKIPSVSSKNQHKKRAGADEKSGKPTGFGAVFAAVAEPIGRSSKQIMSYLAARYGLYIYSGTFIVCENGRLYNTGYLYGPSGECLGSQKKLHLTEEELEMGLSCGDELRIFDLPFGKTAFPICMDATYFETFRIAVEQGAEIVAVPISDDEEYSMWRARRGIWSRVQESFVYGLKASQNGWVAGIRFTGISGIFVPLSMTADGTGVLAAAPGPEGDALVSCKINVDKIRQARESAMYYGDSNPAFEEGYVEKIYACLDKKV